MSLAPEWSDRIKRWTETLKSCIYRKADTVQLKGFVTREQLTLQQAGRRAFKPVQGGTSWGAKWTYAWFRCSITVPPGVAGRMIVFKSGVSGEALVWVDGVEAGSVSWGRNHILLTKNAKPGRTFEIMMEAYAGHGATPCEFGPVPHGVETVPEPPARQQTVTETSFGILEEDAYQLLMDVEVLQSLRPHLDKDSLRLAEVDAALRDFTCILDLELPPDEMVRTAIAARKRLAPVLKAVNGSTAPVMHAFGHGHIDLAWLWPLAETERKAARTFSNQLRLMKQYPSYRYLQSEPHLYRMVKDRHPALYRRIKEAVRRGQLIADGGMWVEPDMNITGGESLIRQCLHGKRFFREEFGIENELLWLPDAFGYSAALPQILRGCGIKYFATGKMFWTYHGGDRFPHNTFLWEGIDGSSVLTHLFDGYGGSGSPAEAIWRWNSRSQKDGISTMLLCFGHGDGGGGPTRDHVESVLRIGDLEGCPRVRISGPVEFFKDQEKRGIPDARYVGELYFQAHRGTYTSQARTKKGNRRSELGLREAEMWGVAAVKLAGFKYPAALADFLWKKLLLNQFHDILPGSSIARVYEEAERDFGEVIRESGRIAAKAASALVRRGKGLTVFNSLSWPRKALVELPAGWKGAVDTDGFSLVVQRTGGKTIAEVTAPSCGWISIAAGQPKQAAQGTGATAGNGVLENEHLKLRFDRNGEISSIWDKDSGREIAAGPCNRFMMYKDVPTTFDAWDIDKAHQATPVKLAGGAVVQVSGRGPLAASLSISRRINNSVLTQVVELRRGSRRVDFRTRIDWRESHKLLKVAFPVNVHADHAVHDIQFGHVRRPNHYSRPYDEDRFEVANQKWTALAEEGRGAAVLNDCKYGVNVFGNSINLTLLRAAKAPDMNADQGVQEFTYSFYAWNGCLAESDIVRESYELNCPALAVTGSGGKGSLLSVDARNVVIETVKPAEDGSGDVIVRLWEAMRTAAKCVLSTSLRVKRARATDMLERTTGEIRVAAGGGIHLDFRPFEIKTVRLTVKQD